MNDISSLIEQYIQNTKYLSTKKFTSAKDATKFAKDRQDQFEAVLRIIGELSSIIHTDGDGIHFLTNDGVYRSIPGGSSSTDKISYSFIAGTIINGGKALMIDLDGKVYPFDITNPYHYDKYIGVAETSAVLDDFCVVVLNGILTSIGAEWEEGKPYYIQSSGTLGITPPATGWIKQVGVGVTSDNILINNHLEFEAI